MKLADKVAIVTGASSGIGREIAYQYVKEGANVLAVARRADRLSQLVEDTNDFTGKLVTFSADLVIKDNIDKMIDEAISKFGKLDILVNNVGIMDDMSAVGDASEEMYDKVMNLNVKTIFLSMRKAVKYFQTANGGIIINIASIGGLKGGIAGAVYTASKHAVVGLTKNTGDMYAKKNIRCNAICPGAVMTEVASGEYMQQINMDWAEVIGLSQALNPRACEPVEIAKVAVFLASDDSSFINGQCIAVDGGWTAAM
jgi:NAD(P)-dependent dehydrogenase (short-subunit alcohol dehydrogenase family)